MIADYFRTCCAVIFICIILSVLCFDVAGQQLEINQVEVTGGKFAISYNLTDSTASKLYTVRLFSSQDNFMRPMSMVSGDVGTNLRPGLKRKIIWDPKELGEIFEGNIALEVRVREYIPFLTFEAMSEKKIKRLKPITLNWTGGAPRGSANNILKVELYQKDKKVATFEDAANVGHSTVELPKTIKPGYYRFRISDSRNKDEVVFSDEFRVTRRIPLLLKIVPVLALTGVAYLLLPQEEPNNFIPDPPDIGKLK